MERRIQIAADPASHRRDIVVVGASAGGVEALLTLIGSLPADLPAAVFIVLHVSPTAESALPEILGRAGTLPVSHAGDGDPIELGRVMVAPPDRHLLVRRGEVRVARGPRENGHRPAVDPLFRSAAEAYGPRVIAMVLSGSLDDGSDGLVRVNELGGVGVVQDPLEAINPGMPRSAIEYGSPEYVLPVGEMGALLERLLTEPLEQAGRPGVRPEHPFSADDEPATGLTCPECSGALWEDGEGDRFRLRCRVGHAYSLESMLAGQSQAVEAALWTAMRSLEERASLARRIATRFDDRGGRSAARRFHRQADDVDARATVLRGVLASLELLEEAGSPPAQASGSR